MFLIVVKDKYLGRENDPLQVHEMALMRASQQLWSENHLLGRI